VRVAATLDNTPGGEPTPAKAGDDVFIDPVIGSKRLSNYLCAVSSCALPRALTP